MRRVTVAGMVLLAGLGASWTALGQESGRDSTLPDTGGVLLRQPDGTWQAPAIPESGEPYRATPAYPGSSFAPVYDRRGDRVGTVETDAAGSRFYDRRGDLR